MTRGGVVRRRSAEGSLAALLLPPAVPMPQLYPRNGGGAGRGKGNGGGRVGRWWKEEEWSGKRRQGRREGDREQEAVWFGSRGALPPAHASPRRPCPWTGAL